MRLFSLFVVFNLTLCTTGAHSVLDLFADESSGLGSHYHDNEQSDSHDSLEHNSTDLEIITSHAEHYDCCLEVVPSSNDGGNFNATHAIISYLPFLSSENDSDATQYLDSVFTKRPHGPPDIYLLHSSYLL